MSALLVLQSRGRVTAAELATELEISERTARRDLEALAMAGIPVYSQPGRNGGWSLVGGARTDLSGLTASEARTLFLLAGPSSSVTPEAKKALRKLVQALPETFRADAEAAASAVVLDPARWGSTKSNRPRHLDALQQAVIEGVQVVLGYYDRVGSESRRVVHPLGLVEKGSVWYLVADTAKGMRTFRVNRVKSVDVTDDPVVRPADFDLAETWDSVVATIDERRTSMRATVRIDRRYVGMLRGHFGGDAIVGDEHDDGQVEVELGGASANQIAANIAGYAPWMEVIEPAEVRDALADIGIHLTARYVATSESLP